MDDSTTRLIAACDEVQEICRRTVRAFQVLCLVFAAFVLLAVFALGLKLGTEAGLSRCSERTAAFP